jgi:iron(III) transport system substrate-binding protein
MTMRKRAWLGMVLAAGMLLAACGKSAPTQPTGGGGSASPAPAEENKLVVYTARDKAVVDYVVQQFEAKYPEYKGQVQVLTMGAQQIMERVRAEKENPQGDVWWGGTQAALSLAAKEGLLASVKPSFADKIPAQYKDASGQWYGEIILPEVIMYNTEALKPENAPQDWDDLLDPKWKGKILIRAVPASGTMRTIYTAMIDRFYKQDGKPDRGYDWLKKLDANTKEYTADPTTLYLKMSRQEGLVSLWNLQDILIQKEQKKMPFGYVIPKSGAILLVDGVAVIKNAKHPKAATKFLELLFDTQVRAELANKYFQIPTVPMDKAQQPAWMKDLDLKPLDLQWDVMAANEKTWIEYWDQNIKGKGGK